MEPMTLEMAQKIHKYYLCSRCWNPLNSPIPTDDGGFLVLCVNCGEETRGYISQRRAESLKGESISQEREVLRMLRKSGYIPDPLAGKTKKELVTELGF